MNTEQQIEIPQRDRLRLRAVVTAIDRELWRMTLEAAPDHRESNRGLIATWSQLVELLALGLAPEIIECPTCKHVGMRAATRCGHCWARLVPRPAVALT